MNLRSVRMISALFLLTLPLKAGAQDALPEQAVSPLPANAKRSTTDIKLGASDIRYSTQDMRFGSASILTSVKDLLANLRGIRVDETAIELRIVLESDVLFDFDKWNIRPDAQKSLLTVAQALEQFKGRAIRLVGHTDSKGDDAYNRKLSLKRADSVKRFFLAVPSLAGFQFGAEGKGESDPAVSNTLPDGRDDPDGRQKNRRVEIRIPK